MTKKRILLAVTGGIAAYKACALTSKLIQANYDVRVMMTESATKFVQPLTFQALSRSPVYTDTFIEPNPEKIAHIDIADWADLVVVAPASANTIAKLAHGIADNMVTTTVLATKAPVWIAPAMNVNMYEHKAVRRNMQQLADDGVSFIEPNAGFLACGWIGKGRLEEPEEIVAHIERFFAQPALLAGKRIVVTAGPTRERIDPVRYLTNDSSGKMGYAIAEAAKQLGANVTLVTGPTALTPPSDVTVVRVESAQQMYEAVMERFATSDIVVKTAAVADYRPTIRHDQKMKKTADELTLKLEKTTDILAALGAAKQQQVLVGFAAETNDVATYAKEKLTRKNADFIVANNVSDRTIGFASDDNAVTIYGRNGSVKELAKASKQAIASQLFAHIVAELEGK